MARDAPGRLIEILVALLVLSLLGIVILGAGWWRLAERVHRALNGEWGERR